jgi:hypothetical protein
MAARMREFGKPEAATNIADELERLAHVQR